MDDRPVIIQPVMVRHRPNRPSPRSTNRKSAPTISNSRINAKYKKASLDSENENKPVPKECSNTDAVISVPTPDPIPLKDEHPDTEQPVDDPCHHDNNDETTFLMSENEQVHISKPDNDSHDCGQHAAMPISICKQQDLLTIIDGKDDIGQITLVRVENKLCMLIWLLRICGYCWCVDIDAYANAKNDERTMQTIGIEVPKIMPLKSRAKAIRWIIWQLFWIVWTLLIFSLTLYSAYLELSRIVLLCTDSWQVNVRKSEMLLSILFASRLIAISLLIAVSAIKCAEHARMLMLLNALDQKFCSDFNIQSSYKCHVNTTKVLSIIIAALSMISYLFFNIFASNEYANGITAFSFRMISLWLWQPLVQILPVLHIIFLTCTITKYYKKHVETIKSDQTMERTVMFYYKWYSTISTVTQMLSNYSNMLITVIISISLLQITYFIFFLIIGLQSGNNLFAYEKFVISHYITMAVLIILLLVHFATRLNNQTQEILSTDLEMNTYDSQSQFDFVKILYKALSSRVPMRCGGLKIGYNFIYWVLILFTYGVLGAFIFNNSSLDQTAHLIKQ